MELIISGQCLKTSQLVGQEWIEMGSNKLAKARKMRKPPGTLGLKKFGPGKIWVENVSTQNTCILAFLHTFVLISGNPTKTKNIFL